MSKNPNSSLYHDVLPGELTPDDIASSNSFFESLSLAELDEWTQDRIEIHNYNGQRFRMLVDRRGDSNQVVGTLLEVGTNMLRRGVLKSRVVRDITAPEATLIMQPSSIFGEPNMNYSSEERHRLSKGDLQPVIGRIGVVMADIGRPEDVTLFGPSQGAMTALGYASHDMAPAAAVAIVETPTIIDRSGLQLALDFMSSGRDLQQVIEANFLDHSAPIAAYIESSAKLTHRDLLRLHPDTFATIGAMRYASATPAIKTILDKGGGVLQAWGDQDKVSPAAVNERIAEMFEGHPRYSSRVLRGMSHAATDFYALDGALARAARNSKTG